MKKEAVIIVEIKWYELVDYSLSYGSLECELVDCSRFFMVALLFARIWKISRKDNYWLILSVDAIGRQLVLIGKGHSVPADMIRHLQETNDNSLIGD